MLQRLLFLADKLRLILSSSLYDLVENASPISWLGDPCTKNSQNTASLTWKVLIFFSSSGPNLWQWDIGCSKPSSGNPQSQKIWRPSVWQELNIENNGHWLRIRILGGFEKIWPECSTDGACAVADSDDSWQRKIKVRKEVMEPGNWKVMQHCPNGLISTRFQSVDKVNSGALIKDGFMTH